MHQYWIQFLTIAIAHLLAVMSPGPDFAVVTKNSLSYSKKIGIYTALGVGLGISIHVTYSLLGIGFLISKSIILFNAIKWIGAGYLIYIGYKAIRSKPMTAEKEETKIETGPKKILTPWQAIRNGFLVNVLNPKATLFFLALFTQVVSPGTPTLIKLFYGIEMMTATFIWFTFVSLVFSHPKLKQKISKAQPIIDRITGGVLIAIGLKVALTHK